MAAASTPRTRRMGVRALVVASALVIAIPASTGGVTPAYVSSPNPAVVFVPLVNSGASLFGDIFEGIPDGIGVVPGPGKHPTYVDLYVNHEQSMVPFPPVAGFADFQNSSVTRVRVDLATKAIIDMGVALPSSAGFIRFCSSTIVTGNGFHHPMLFTNEESNDPLVVPAGATYPADPYYGGNNIRQAGYTVALDTVTGAITPIAGMGRHNHENQVLVPGGWHDKLAFLSGDDTFTAPGSQLYMYLANKASDVLSDKGHLWAFQVTKANGVAVDPYNPWNGANDFLDISAGETFSGRFIQVPDDIARGTSPGGEPQGRLEAWSNFNNVFQFVRVEDIAYDPDSPRTIYFADTGTTRLKEDPNTGRLLRLPSTDTTGTNSNGRIFKMVLNKHDPKRVDSLTILADSATVGFVNPDNVAVSHNSIMVQEDNSTLVAGSLDNDVWNYSMGSGTWTEVASATQFAAAETSGIVDMSKWLGPGWWALDVQSHVNLLLPDPPVPGTNYTVPWPLPPTVLTTTARREDGQLLFMYVPGS
ncbi:MAG: alkaline phosphatase PhoX [Candidatus Limnocylindria bacterium]